MTKDESIALARLWNVLLRFDNHSGTIAINEHRPELKQWVVIIASARKDKGHAQDNQGSV